MELQEVEVVIGKDGRVTILVRGAKGAECLDITASLEEALGGKVAERQFTYEFYERKAEEEERRRVGTRD